MNRKIIAQLSLSAIISFAWIGLDAGNSTACEPTGGPKFGPGECIDSTFGWTGPCREYIDGVPEALARFNVERGKGADRSRIIDYIEFKLFVIPTMGMPYEKSIVLKRSNASCTTAAANLCMEDWLVKGKGNDPTVRATSLDGINAKLTDKTGAEFWLYYTWMCPNIPLIAKDGDQVMLEIYYATVDPGGAPASCRYLEGRQPDIFQIVPPDLMICP